MKNNILFRIMILFFAIAILQGCATTPYKNIEEKRINQKMLKANESYALGMYTKAGQLFGKAVQLAVIQQEHQILAEAQFKLALSLERSFQTKAAITKAWQQARYYSEKYNYQPFTVILGWFNWVIQESKNQPEIMSQELEQFQGKYPPKNTNEKIQMFNLMAKWHLSIETPDKANYFLGQAQVLIDQSGLDQGLSLTLFNKAMVAVHQGKFNYSIELLEKSLAIDSRDNNISGVYANLEAQAKIYDILGKSGPASIIREQLRDTQNYILSKPL